MRSQPSSFHWRSTKIYLWSWQIHTVLKLINLVFWPSVLKLYTLTQGDLIAVGTKKGQLWLLNESTLQPIRPQSFTYSKVNYNSFQFQRCVSQLQMINCQSLHWLKQVTTLTESLRARSDIWPGVSAAILWLPETPIAVSPFTLRTGETSRGAIDCVELRPSKVVHRYDNWFLDVQALGHPLPMGASRQVRGGKLSMDLFQSKKVRKYQTFCFLSEKKMESLTVVFSHLSLSPIIVWKRCLSFISSNLPRLLVKVPSTQSADQSVTLWEGPRFRETVESVIE